MPERRVNIAYKIEETGEERAFYVRFSEDEWQRLHLFLRNVEELRASGLLKEDLRCSMRVKAKSDEPGRCEVVLPSRPTIALLLHQLRPLILHKHEEANFLKTAKLVEQRVDDQRLRGLIKDLRRQYDGRQSQEMFSLVSNGRLLNSDDTVFDCLNGFEYHRNKEKRESIEATYGVFPPEAVHAILISLLIDKLYAILDLESMVSTLVCRTKKLKLLAAERALSSVVHHK